MQETEVVDWHGDKQPGHSVARTIAGLGGTLSLVAFFMPWFTACDTTVSGSDIASQAGSNGIDGSYVVLWAVLAAAAAILLVSLLGRRGAFTSVTLVAAATGIVLILLTFADARESVGGDLRVEYGFYLESAGFVAAAIAAAAALASRLDEPSPVTGGSPLPSAPRNGPPNPSGVAADASGVRLGTHRELKSDSAPAVPQQRGRAPRQAPVPPRPTQTSRQAGSAVPRHAQPPRQAAPVPDRQSPWQSPIVQPPEPSTAPTYARPAFPARSPLTRGEPQLDAAADDRTMPLAPPAPSLNLAEHREGRPVRSLSVAPDTVFGRDKRNCDVTVDDSFVSRRHLRIALGPDGWQAQDLGSSNGTLIRHGGSWEQLIGQRPVEHGVELRIGATTFVVSMIG